MFARFLLILLAIVLATPVAAAACHAQPERGHHPGMAHHQPVPADSDDAAPADACVGCVPPSDWIAPRLAEPVAFAAPRLSATVATLHLGQATPPALPPPRIG